MRKNVYQELFIDEEERKKQIVFYSSIIIVLSLISILLTYFTLSVNRTKYVTYQENSSVNYKVNLISNDFIKDSYIKDNQEYIASMIDTIDTELSYHSIIDEKVAYQYQYKVYSDINIIDKSNKNVLYNYKDLLVPSKEFKDSNNNNIDIHENVQIDYHKYNDMVLKFLDTYQLDKVKAYADVILSIDLGDNQNNSKNQTIVKMTVPLAVKTVAIDTNDNNKDLNHMLIYHSKTSIVLLLVCLIIFCIDVMVIVRFFDFSMNSRSVRDIYDQQLRKILSKYHNYIQKISNEFEFNGYQVLYVNEFSDLLDIRSTISEPILMTSDINNKATFFIVPSKTKILYVYSIRIKDIKRELKEMQ